MTYCHSRQQLQHSNWLQQARASRLCSQSNSLSRFNHAVPSLHLRARADETTIVFERAGDERHETLSPARGGQPKDNYPLVVVIIVYLTDPCGVAGKASSMFFPAGERARDANV